MREQSDHAFPVPTGIFENDSVMASKPGRLIAPYRCGRRQLPLDGSATAPLVTGTHTRWLATSIITINFCRLASRTATVTIVPPAQCRNGKRAYLSRSFQKENVSDYLPGAGHSPLRRAIFPRFMRRPISLLPHSVRCLKMLAVIIGSGERVLLSRDKDSISRTLALGQIGRSEPNLHGDDVGKSPMVSSTVTFLRAT